MVTVFAILAIAIVTPFVIMVQRKVVNAHKENLRELAHAEHLSQLERKMCNRLSAF